MNTKSQKKRGAGVVHISGLFQKYANTLTAPQGTVIQAFVETVDEFFGITIPKAQCTYSPASKTLVYKGSGMLKSEILLKKQEILNSIQQKVGKKSTPKELL